MLAQDPKHQTLSLKVAYCSCTDEPSWAAECMRLFEVGDGITMEQAAPIKQIFKATKTEHFTRINKATGMLLNPTPPYTIHHTPYTIQQSLDQKGGCSPGSC